MSRIALMFVSLLAVGIAGCVTTPNQVSSELPWYAMPRGIETRWASHENPKGERGVGGQANAGRKGAPAFTLAPGAHYVLTDVQGSSGTVHRIWMTINDRSPEMLRGLRLDFYWDGAETPAVSAPLGDFFGHGLGRMATFENAIFSSPEGRSFNCAVPMPFKTGMKMVVTNETDTRLGALYYDVSYTLGDEHGDDTLYFHAIFNRENPTTLKQDFEILPQVRGRGRYLGTTISVIPDSRTYWYSWWGEGEAKVYLDGDRDWPTLVGTGTEDYIGTGWGQEQYDTMYQGCHIADKDMFRYAFYRLHIPDPVYFYQECRVTMQQIGYDGGGLRKHARENEITIYRTGEGLEPVDLSGDEAMGLFERTDDWAACTYFYLDRPENGLPPLAPLQERVAGL